jgi:hypothetical protein
MSIERIKKKQKTIFKFLSISIRVETTNTGYFQLIVLSLAQNAEGNEY